MRAQFERQAFQGERSTPQALAAIVKEEHETWKQAIRDAGMAIE